MKYFSMFSGIGGFELGIQRAYDNQCKVSAEQTDGGAKPNDKLNDVHQPTLSCIGYSEIDKYAIKVYERQFNGHKNYGDCTAIDAQQLPDFDLLVGGFPCQAFSIAGKRYGFQDTRGTLFFDIGRILANKRPRHLVLENVKGLLSHDNGKTFQTIIGVLTDLGYTVEWQVLNSKDFGVPQNRERVIIVGHLGAECSGQVFPITGTDSKDIEQLNQPKHSNDRVYGTEGISPTLNTMQGGNRQPFIAAQRGRENGQTLEAQKEDKSNTLTAVAKDNYVVDMPRIRRLTPKECERLQGFPDDWTKYGVGDELISDTQRYKMCGNAVTTNVIQAVMESFCN
jgi:DNA (cytosine-5)-methyltransferase 1